MKFKLENTFKFIKSYNLYLYLLVVLLIAYVFLDYEGAMRQCYNEYVVIPCLSKMTSNIFLGLSTLVLLSIVGYDIKQKTKNKYRYDEKIIFAIFIVDCLLFGYRISGLYDYVSFLWFVSYVDIVGMIGTAYIISAVINIKPRLNANNNNKKNHNTTGINKILRDWPIEKIDDDIFDLKNDVEKIATEIKSLDTSSTWSLAITAQWGAGKTSFMNLIVGMLDDKVFDIIHFNPRDSASANKIQEDFFNVLSCALAKYDSSCSGVMKDYMASLQLIDNRQFIEKAICFYKVWNKEDLKEKLKKACCQIPKRFLILVDDYDRLSKEEIMEVLKLIDSNAAFSNLIFLTAYDKMQVNKALGEAYKTEDACFVDKFFNLEFAIPSRPYSYISRYIEAKLCQLIEANSTEKNQFSKVLTNRQNLLQKYVPTLRDAKRYVNQFVIDYAQIRGDVNIDEYILVQLVKYKYPDEYKRLYKKEFVERDGLFADGSIYYLKKDIPSELQCSVVLELLFPKEKVHIQNAFRHIYDVQSFENYFVNQIYGSLRIRDMESIFHGEIKEAYEKIDEWMKQDDNTKDIIDYLNSFDMDCFDNGIYYQRYAVLIAYIAMCRPQSRAFWLLLRLVYLQNLKRYDKKYNLDLKAYKASLLEILSNTKYDTNLNVLRSMYVGIKTNEMKDEEQLIKSDDILPIIKKEFLNLAATDTDEGELLDWLYICIDYMEPSRKLILDKECLEAYKNHVIEHPEEYIRRFVRLGSVSTSPEFNNISCEPYWEQIFENKSTFEKFIDQCSKKQIPFVERVQNFWRLYNYNGMKPIEFDNQGNVQDKIDSNLVHEVSLLDRLLNIKNELDEIPSDCIDISSEEKKRILDKLKALSKELDNVKLYIKLNTNIQDNIQQLLELY